MIYLLASPTFLYFILHENYSKNIWTMFLENSRELTYNVFGN